MRALLFIVSFLGLSLSELWAGGELEFAVPDDGRVTLGVFDDAGKLVRVLHSLTPEQDFQVGLNGLITTWDGKNSQGEQVPAGHYYVRGYLVGTGVTVSGERYLFNDFAEEPGFTGLTRLKDFALLENGDVLLLTIPGGLARFSPAQGFLWTRALEGEVLAANSRSAFVFPGGSVVSLEDGELLPQALPSAVADPIAATANDAALFTSLSAGLSETPLSGDSAPTPLPSPTAFTTMDADSGALLGASAQGVWIRRGSFEQIPLPAAAKSVSLGSPGTFWFVGDGDALVAQASFSGEILRVLRSEAGGPVPEKIHAARTGERFLVLDSAGSAQRLRMMSRSDSGEWTIDWEKTVEDCTKFGFVDGQPKASVPDPLPPNEAKLRLKKNPLTGKHPFLTVRAEFDASGSRLVSPDGLVLVQVSSRTDITRVVIHRGDKPDSLIFLQGNGIFVEEFSISGLSEIVPLDVGGIEIP